MKKNKLVSIVIPNYNEASRLKEAILSSLHQTYENIEILLCDDGSTDSSRKVIKRLKKKSPKHIRYFLLEHSGSPAIPRNIGIKNARGLYIAFLDSDDVMTKDRLQIQVKFLEENPKIDVLCSEAIMFREDSKSTEPYLKNIPEGRITFKQLLEVNLVIQSTVLMRRKLTDNIGYNYEKNLLFHEDWEYWLRTLCLGGKIYFLPQPLIRYRIDPKGISRSLTRERHLQKSINTLDILLQTATPNKETRKVIKRKINNYKRHLLKMKSKKFFQNLISKKI